MLPVSATARKMFRSRSLSRCRTRSSRRMRTYNLSGMTLLKHSITRLCRRMLWWVAQVPWEIPMMRQSWKIILYALCAVAWSAVVAVGANLSAAGGAAAETYPSKFIKVVVPLSAGSPIDLIARVIAPALSSRLKQSVIVENRPGGGTATGTRAVAAAPADGYTLLFASAGYTVGPALTKNLGYDPIRDFVPIATVGSGSWVLVVAPSLPVHSVPELIAYAKANPGKLNWGFGRNAGPHLLGELFVLATGIEVNRVYYKSGADAVPDLLGGR